MQALFSFDPVTIHLNRIDLIRLLFGQTLIVKQRIQVICCSEKDGIARMMEAHQKLSVERLDATK